MSRYQVAALYIDPKGPYPDLAVECYDADRDARRYEGPHRVIAHPPCAQWGRLRYMAKRGDGQKVLGPIAVDQVREYGGVLEHPAESSLWLYCGLPLPGSLFADEFGGRSYVIQQGDFGHVAPKLTWLYAVGLSPCPLHMPRGKQPGRVELQGKRQRLLTPPPLAELLCRWVTS